MPAILAHHLFGRVILARQDNKVFRTRNERDAFLLGNQGADPLFYATRSHLLVQVKTLGSQMHSQYIPELLEAWRRMAGSDPLLGAYVAGYVCHYTLDRAAHPLVYAFEEALLATGVEGLNKSDDFFVHCQIEADLDMYMLYQLAGRTLDEYVLPKQVLYSSEAALARINELYRAAARLHGITVPAKVFTLGVHDMRAVTRLLYSPGGTKRALFGRLERLARPHSLLQAMSHRREAAFDCWYANEEGLPWLHPQTRERHTEGFAHLFETALDDALVNLQLWQEGALITKITQGLNFSGNRVVGGGD